MKISFIPTLLAGLLVITACEKENPPPPDPCKEISPITADFIIQENVADSLVETDSVLMYNSVTFQATGSPGTYTWKIGRDERTFSGHAVSLRFLDDAVGEIPVQLIVEGRPKTECFPEDDGIDTLVQTFHVIEWGEAPIIGKYEGYFESNPDKKDEIVEVKFITPEEDISFEPNGGFELINIDMGCKPFPREKNTSLWNYISRGARALKFDAYEGSRSYFYNCNAPNAWLDLYSSDTLVIDFTYGSIGTEERFEDKFIGVRKIE